MKVNYLLLSLVLFGYLIISNPSEEKHDSQIVNAFDNDNPLRRLAIRGGLKLLRYDNYVLFSIKGSNLTGALSIGCCGVVFTLNSTDTRYQTRGLQKIMDDKNTTNRKSIKNYLFNPP